MDIRSLIESWIFRFRKIPPYRTSMLNNTPKGERTLFKMQDITIGNMPWKKGWEKGYVHGEDPMFRLSKPWAAHESSDDNVKKTSTGITLTQPKEKDAKSAYLFSNFTIKYGTVRALVKCPCATGMWSAFWLFGKSGTPECDIFEHCGEWENEVAVTHHWGYDYGGPYGKKSTLHNARYNKNFNPSKEFYLYEIEFGPYSVVYKINGVVVKRMKKGIPSGENHILFDVVKGQYCGTDPNAELSEDGVMEVKFLEIFKI